ncbi:uncharacterized protein M421DRAFT_349206 [Didymella exigua CBS 183.55]|uniref:Uncharacterized protein n=1 Tax=Didymella exigua CBS 183.55 TaxID=1150837 RepID=A0A6A5R6G0_9PLEO|nr:uncharacterized protein M421DRAFT_349206 [Didymella exigua CBS 183.55]KAF1922800.1 hypothetical protein M421DRAFT_349206 [Didymella exigua CBS 183.55]
MQVTQSPVYCARPEDIPHAVKRHWLSAMFLSCPVLSCPVLSYPVLSCPILSCPVLSCPVLSCPILSCSCSTPAPPIVQTRLVSSALSLSTKQYKPTPHPSLRFGARPHGPRRCALQPTTSRSLSKMLSTLCLRRRWTLLCMSAAS